MAKMSKSERSTGAATERNPSVKGNSSAPIELEAPHLSILPQTSVRSERSGRTWKLPLSIEHSKPPPVGHQWSGPYSVNFPSEREIIQNTCEFLREHAPHVYKRLYLAMKATHPGDPMYPNRQVRLAVEPDQASSETAEKGRPSRAGDTLRQVNFSFTPPKLGPSHWAFKRHQHLNRNEKVDPANEQEIAKRSKKEAQADTGEMTRYLEGYKELFADISGKKLWQATYDADVSKGPYLTCMEVVLEHVPRGAATSVLSFVHLGIGLHLMHELSLPWEAPSGRSFEYKVLHESLKDSFRALARLFREDFGVEGHHS